MSSEVLVVEQEGQTVLAVPTGVSASDFIRSEIGALQRESGWIVRDAGIEAWPIRGFLQRDGQIHFWGDYLAGKRLEECLDDAPDANLARLKALAGALQRLRSEKVPQFPVRTDGVLFLDDGAVLFMPPGMMQRISLLRPFGERARTFNVLNSPFVSGEAALAFSIGALAYRFLLGSFPFTGEDDVEVNRRIRSLSVTPPALQRPELVPELSRAIVRSLGRPGKDKPSTLEEWVAILFRALAQGYTREVGAAERAAAEAQARGKTVRTERSYRRAVFFQRHWRLIAIIGAIVAVVGAVLGSILSNVLAPRPTKGFPPRQVVETFYSSMGTLDHATMEACVVNKAGQGEVNEAMILFVMSRQSVGYEGKSYIVSAADWDKQDRPALSAEYSIYGAIVRSVIEEKGEPAPVYLVTYQKWEPQPESTDQTGGQAGDQSKRSFGYDRVDRLKLRKDKGDWVIYEIDRLSSTPVGAL